VLSEITSNTGYSTIPSGELSKQICWANEVPQFDDWIPVVQILTLHLSHQNYFDAVKFFCLRPAKHLFIHCRNTVTNAIY
jgi:hypothetical protein